MGKGLRGSASATTADRLANRTVPAKIIIGLLAVGSVFVSIVSAPGVTGLLASGFALVMFAIAIIDLRKFIIPDWLNVVGVALASLHAAAQEPTAAVTAIAAAGLRGAVLAVIFLALRYGYARLRGRQGLGLGDVKLAFVAGAWLDWLVVPIAVELAALGALLGYLVRRFVLGHAITETTRMPFGLFFAPAIWVAWLIQTRWLDWP
jgi:leader peptidase (prepilin peptidase)/N-methyltransferase